MKNTELSFLITRLWRLATVYLYSMQTEFWHTKDSVRDWKEKLELLERALWPLEEFINLNDGDAENRKQFEYFAYRLQHAIKLLNQFSDGDNAVKVIYSARTQLKIGLKDLEHWNAKLQVDTEERVDFNNLVKKHPTMVVSPGRIRAQLIKDSAMDDLRSAKSDLDTGELTRKLEVDACMRSRSAYLIAHYVCFFYPDIWTSADVKEFSSLHKSILDKITRGTQYVRSMQARLEDIETFLNPLKHSTYRLAA